MNENDTIYRNFVRDFSNTMCTETEGRSYSNIVFLCIGTQRLIGDAFGPLVGNKLTTLLRSANKLNVVGTLENSVCSSNIAKTISTINQNFCNPFIVAIDAALSTTENIGRILVSDGGITIGSSLNRQCTTVGDMSIRGVVGRNCGNANQNLNILQNVPLSRVVNLSDIVSTGIYNTINYECNE